MAILKRWLIDTGPLVAYLNARDPVHPDVVERLDPFRGELYTTSAVITEAMHFLAASREGPRALAGFVTNSELAVVDFTQPASLRDSALLMEKYSDTPMDFADATLVLLAERIEVRDILTLDRRGFTAFRTPSGSPFRLVLG